jgi:hypothetical protein
MRLSLDSARFRRAPCVLLAATLLLAASSSADAQSAASAPSGMFLDRSYIARVVPDMGLLYEAQAAIPLYLRSSMDGLLAPVLADNGGWGRGMTFFLTPMFRIRQLSEHAAPSSPVRTPSFMPKLTAQLFAAHQLGSSSGGSGEKATRRAVLLEMEGSIGHYSNGQAGCFLASEQVTAEGSGDCERDPAAPPTADTLNTMDGSFSTWYLGWQGHVRRIWFGGTTPRATLTIGLGVDWHAPFFKPIGGMDDQLAAFYGRWRPFASVEATRRTHWSCGRSLLSWLPCGRGRLRTSLAGEYIATRPPGIPPVASAFELAWTWHRYLGLGALLRVHRGQDYYNMALAHRLNVTQLGLVFDLERDAPTSAASRPEVSAP